MEPNGPVVQRLEGQPLWLLVAIWVIYAATVYLLTPAILSVFLRIAKRTQSRLDDLMLKAARGPLRTIFLIIGVGVVIEAAALPDQFRHYARPTLFALIAVAVVVYADRVTRAVLATYMPEPAQAARSIIAGAARGLVIAVGGLIVLDSLGVSINAVLATLGVGSLAVALGLQDTLSQFLAGMFIAMDQPIRMGDYVRVASGEEGIVEKVGWRSTRLRMPQNTMVIIPNSKLATSTILNFHMPDTEMIIQVPLMIAYGTDLRRAEAILLEVARETVATTAGGVTTPEPQVRFTKFGETGIELNLAVGVAQFTDQVLVKHQLFLRLDERFRREGIVVPYPVREMRLGAEERALFDPSRSPGSRPDQVVPFPAKARSAETES